MTRPSPAPIVRDNIKELGEALLGLPWVPDTGLCSDCPPIGYPTDKTRCLPCPRREEEKQDIDASRDDYDPDVSRRAMK